jgi:transposase
MARHRKYPVELLDRGARWVFESERPIAHVARDLGVPSETLRKLRRVEADERLRPDLPTSDEHEEIKAMRKQVYELRRANEILGRQRVFRDRARRRPTEVSRFIDEHRGRFGIERMWKALLKAGERVGRDRVKGLMRIHGIQGAKRRDASAAGRAAGRRSPLGDTGGGRPARPRRHQRLLA